MLPTTANSRAIRRPPCRYGGALLVLSVAMLFLMAQSARAAVEIGSVVFAKGAVSARSTDGEVRLLARNSEIYLNDVVSTAEKSFAVLRFTDDTKMSIRPRSQIVVDKFSQGEGEEAAEFSLIKGGLRAITGAIGKKRPENVRFKTRAASIGIRGTDLVIRQCDGDECRLEELELKDYDTVKTNCLKQLDGQPPGVYFAVLDGAIFGEKDDKRIDLDAIAAGYANEKEMTCISAVPRFILNDADLNRINLDWSDIEMHDMLGIDEDDYPACEIY